MNTRLTLLPTLLLAFFLNPFVQAWGEQYTLEKVVEISRHGVRPPTPGDRLLIEGGSLQSWPRWLTEDGNLTGHGFTAAWLKGRYESQRYRQLGLLTAGCPSASDVYLLARPLERTQATAAAYSAAAFPGCGVPVHSLKKNDPLFSLPAGKASEAEKVRSEQEALTALDGNLLKAQQRLQPQIALLRRTVCLPNRPCPAFDNPWKLHIWSNGGVAIDGLDTLAAMAESIRLAWNENLPLSKVAFGHARSAKQVGRLMSLLSVKYDFTNDLPSAARRGGSRLLDQIVKALQPEHSQNAPPDVRWLLFVASDINLSYLRTLIHFSWQQGDYPRNNFPPGGSLVFERWRDKHSQQRYLRIYFQSQSLDQIRQLTPLSVANPLLTTEWHFNGCKITMMGTLCPYHTSLQRIEKLIDTSLLVPVNYPKS